MSSNDIKQDTNNQENIGEQKKKEKEGKSLLKSRRFWGQTITTIAVAIYFFNPFPYSKIIAFFLWIIGQIIAIIGGAKATQPWSIQKSMSDIKGLFKKFKKGGT